MLKLHNKTPPQTSLTSRIHLSPLILSIASTMQDGQSPPPHMTTELLATCTTETILIRSMQGEDNCKVMSNTENLYPYIKAPTGADLPN